MGIGIPTASAAPVDMTDWATWNEREELAAEARELYARAERLYARGYRAKTMDRSLQIIRHARLIEAQADDAYGEARDMGADL